MHKPLKPVLLALFLVAEGSIAIAQRSGSQSGDADRLICRRQAETGSLVKARRQCFTKAQWDRIAESQRIGATRMIDELTGKQQSN